MISKTLLGDAYSIGNGVKKDLTKALSLYEVAAKAGCADAQSNLGKMHLLGLATEFDLVKSWAWLKTSLEPSSLIIRKPPEKFKTTFILIDIAENKMSTENKREAKDLLKKHIRSYIIDESGDELCPAKKYEF